MKAWVILIARSGAFLFEGTAVEAEETRVHKAISQQAFAKKRLATNEEISAREPSECWNHPGFTNKFVYADCQCPDPNCVIDTQERNEK